MVSEPMPSDSWSPILPMPTSVVGLGLGAARDEHRSPTCQSPFSAVAWSIVISPGSSAGPPST